MRGGAPVRRIRSATYRTELVALGLLLLCVPVLPLLTSAPPDNVPLEVWILGLVPGAALSLQAVGVVLVYRAHGFVNFGQLALGTLGAAVFVLMSEYETVLRIVRAACPTCIADEASRGQYLFVYWLSLAVGLTVSLLFAWAVYVLVVRRFENRSRLTLTVASIFLAPASVAIMGVLQLLLTSAQQREDVGQLSGVAPLPFDATITVGVVPFAVSELATIGIAVGAAAVLAVYLRRSRMGMAIRAASDHPARAELLGINTSQVHTRIWLIVGLLSALPTVLGAMGAQPVIYEAPSTAMVMRILLVALVARFVSLPIAAAAGLVVGILDTTVRWSFAGSSVPFDGALVVVVALLLLARSRDRLGRADALRQSTLNTTREVRPIPAELAALPTIRLARRNLTVVGAVLLASLPWVLSPQQTNLATLAFILGIVALSLLPLTGWAGLISLGQIAFAGFGGFVVAVLGLPAPLELILAIALGAVVAVAVGIPALRVRGIYLMVASLAFAVSTATVLVSPDAFGRFLPSTIDRPAALGLSLEDPRTFYYTTLVLLILSATAIAGLRRSRTGRVLLASRDNEQAAESFGIGVVRARLTGFAASGGVAAFAGALLTWHQHGMPLEAFSAGQSIDIFTIAVVGGMGALAGPLLGAGYQGLLLILGSSAAVNALALGFGGLALVLFVPGGLTQVFIGLRDSFLRRVAARNRILVPSLIADRKADESGDRPGFAPVATGASPRFVPRRYELADQWAHALPDELEAADVADDFHGLTDDANLDTVRG